MLNIKIDGYIYKCRDKLQEFSLSTARTIHKMVLDKDYDKREVISICSNIPDDVLLSMSDEQINDLYSKIDVITNYEGVAYFKHFKIGKQVFKVCDFDDFTVEDYGNIQMYLLQDNQFDYLHNILSYLIRPVKVKKQKNILYNKIYSIFYKGVIPISVKSSVYIKYDEESIAKLFDKTLDAATAYTIFYMFMNWDNNLKKEYPDLFKVIEYDDLSEEEYKRYKKIQSFKSRLDKFGIYANVCSVSESLQERDLWWKRNIREFFKFLNYRVVLLEEERKNNK